MTAVTPLPRLLRPAAPAPDIPVGDPRRFRASPTLAETLPFFPA